MKNFAQNWLDIQCQSIEGLCSALFLLTDSERKGLKPAAKWPLDSKEPMELAAVSRLAIKNRDIAINSNVRHEKTGNQSFDYLASPIFIDKKLLGIIAVKTTHHNERKQKKILYALTVGTKWLALPQLKNEQHSKFHTTVVRLAVNCLQQDSFKKSLTVLISKLTKEFNCERVAVGELNNYHAHVTALSNSAKFDDKSNLIRTIASVMDEAVDQDKVIVYPEIKNDKPSIIHAHSELARKFGCGAICTIPFVYEGAIFAVLTMERSEFNPFDQETIHICEQTLALISPFLKLKHTDELIWIQKLSLFARQFVTDLFGYHYLGFKLLGLALIVVICFASVKEGDFRIHADSVLEGRIQRTVSAPMDGFIKLAKVRAGDTVLTGEIMAEMENYDLKLEQTKLSGEQQQLKREHLEAMANRDWVEVRIINSQFEQLDAKIKLKQEQLQRTLIKTPFDGIVIEGDLSQSLGAPVNRGESLFKIAPLDGYRVILKVNERSISYIRHGQKGTLALSSLPDRKFLLQIEKITEVARAEDGSNIFRVEAALSELPKLLRPGMEGVGKVEIGRKKLLWIWTHELVDWIKLGVWSWLP
ncbi:MAG: HlyD family efflux transporter periplasmic adaptor subunit [Methylococcales bacterium]|nr:HlyD family efflux transporter periplasmic adaptor subunit [Methylococcales bacterium]